MDRIKKFSKKQLIDKYYSFYRFKYSENVYNSLISNTNKIDIGQLSVDVILEDKYSDMRVLAVCKLSCEPCGIAHSSLIEQLRKGAPFSLTIRIYFDGHENFIGERKAVESILTLCKGESIERKISILDGWYLSRSLKKFNNLFEKELKKAKSDETYDFILDSEWFTMNRIPYTPFIYLNSVPLDSNYHYSEIQDLAQSKALSK
ncbi:MAG: hypothetical protein ACK57D_01185 [Sphingobacteriales bacterium]